MLCASRLFVTFSTFLWKCGLAGIVDNDSLAQKYEFHTPIGDKPESLRRVRRIRRSSCKLEMGRRLSEWNSLFDGRGSRFPETEARRWENWRERTVDKS
jgi:hypothetical protein